MPARFKKGREGGAPISKRRKKKLTTKRKKRKRSTNPKLKKIILDIINERNEKFNSRGFI